MQLSTLSNQQSPTASGPPSPAFVATSTLLESGILKTIDVPGLDVPLNSEFENLGKHLNTDSANPVSSPLPEWENDSLATFHFVVYTLRPGRPDEVGGSYDESDYEMLTENGIPEEEETMTEQSHEESNYTNEHVTLSSHKIATRYIEPESPDTRSDRGGSLDLKDGYLNSDGTPPTSGDESVSESDPMESTSSQPRVIVRRLVRDTRLTLSGQPFKLRMNRNFVAVGLEMAVKSMHVGEQSRFLLTREATEGFSKLEQALRQQDASHAHYSNHSSRCGSRRGSLQDAGIGIHIPSSSTGHAFGIASSPPLPTHSLGGCVHSHQHQSLCSPLTPGMVAMLRDLQTLPLELHIHLLEHRPPDQTETKLFDFSNDLVVNRPWWFWSPAERTRQAAALCLAGNAYYEVGRWHEAADQYGMCLSLLEDLPNYPQIGTRPTKDGEAKTSLNQEEEKEEEKASVDSSDDDDDEDGVCVPAENPIYLRHTCHLNLAACHLKLLNYTRCITHCSTAISLQPTSAKAHYRRAMARIALGDDLIRAREDLENARRLMTNELQLVPPETGLPVDVN